MKKSQYRRSSNPCGQDETLKTTGYAISLNTAAAVTHVVKITKKSVDLIYRLNTAAAVTHVVKKNKYMETKNFVSIPPQQ